jgi:hypothetical protein
MSNDLPTVIELLVLAADQTAPWLASGDQPLVSGPVQSDVGKYGTAEQTARWFLRGLPDLHGSRHMSSLVSVCAVFVPWWCADGELQDPRLRPLRRATSRKGQLPIRTQATAPTRSTGP